MTGKATRPPAVRPTTRADLVSRAKKILRGREGDRRQVTDPDEEVRIAPRRSSGDDLGRRSLVFSPSSRGSEDDDEG